MKKDFYDEEKKIDISKLTLLSSKGSEVDVYHDSNVVYKIYNENDRLDRRTR